MCATLWCAFNSITWSIRQVLCGTHWNLLMGEHWGKLVAPFLHIDEAVPTQTQLHLQKQILIRTKQHDALPLFELEKMTYLASTQRTVSWHVHAPVDNIHKHMSILVLAYIQLSENRENLLRKSKTLLVEKCGNL